MRAFAFVDAKRNKQYGKWIFEPVGGVQSLTDEEAKAKGASFLFDDLRQRVKDGQVAFNFNRELAEAGDKLDSATVPLPAGRKKVTLGTLKITPVPTDASAPCLTPHYNPTLAARGALRNPLDPHLYMRDGHPVWSNQGQFFDFQVFQ